MQDILECMWMVNPVLWEQAMGQNGKQGLPNTWALHVAQACDLSLSEILQPGLELRHTHDTALFSRHTYPSWPTHTASHLDLLSPLCSTQDSSKAEPPEQGWAVDDASRMHWVIIIMLSLIRSLLCPAAVHKASYIYKISFNPCTHSGLHYYYFHFNDERMETQAK